MKRDRVETILETYGIERILEDNNRTLVELIEILEELGYLCLEFYDDPDVDL